jgi:hypothetical protein
MADYAQALDQAYAAATDEDRLAVDNLFQDIAHGTPPDPQPTTVTPGMAAIIAEERQGEDAMMFVVADFVEEIVEYGETGQWMSLHREIEVCPNYGTLNSDGMEKMIGVVRYGKPVSFRFWMRPLDEHWPGAIAA